MPKIWSPVILAQLDPPQTTTVEGVYQLPKAYQHIEDLRVKVPSCEASHHGKYVECLIRLKVLALLQAFDHQPDLLSFHDEIREWLPNHCFDPPMEFTAGTEMIVEADEVFCEGELQDETLRVKMILNYTVLAVQNGAVEIVEASRPEPYPEPEPYYPGKAILETIRNLECEVERLSQDTAALHHRIRLYEKNLAGLKNALRKAENRSQALVKELMHANRTRQDLQEQLNKREAPYSLQKSPGITPSAEINRVGLGHKIKQLFALGRPAVF